MNYYDAARIRKKGFANLMTDKLASGQGVISSFRGALSDRSKAKSLAMKEKFDPMNIAKFLTGGSNLAPAIVGRLTGRSKEDIGYFTGKRQYQYTPRQSSYWQRWNNPNMSGGSKKATEVLEKIVSFMEKSNEEDIKEQEIMDSYNELNEYIKRDNHKEVVDVFKQAIKNKRKAMKQMAKEAKRRQAQEKAREKAEQKKQETKTGAPSPAPTQAPAPTKPPTQAPAPSPAPAPAPPPVKPPTQAPAPSPAPPPVKPPTQAPAPSPAPPVKPPTQAPAPAPSPAPAPPPVKPPTQAPAPSQAPAPAPAKPPTAAPAPPVPAKPPTATPAPARPPAGPSARPAPPKGATATKQPFDINENVINFTSALKARGITDKNVLSAVLGNAMKETGLRQRPEDSHAGTPNDRLITLFGNRLPTKIEDGKKVTDIEALNKLKQDPEAFFEKVYGKDWKTYRGKDKQGNEIWRNPLGNTEAGEGYKYRGRGYLQLTGKEMYANASKALFGDDRLVKDPDLLNDPKTAAAASAWLIQKRSASMAKELGYDINNLTAEQAQLLATSIVAGKPVNPNDAGFTNQENYKRAAGYASMFRENGIYGKLVEETKANTDLKQEMKNNGGTGPSPIVNQNNITNKQKNVTVNSAPLQELNPRIGH
jgi:hypothetical protein